MRHGAVEAAPTAGKSITSMGVAGATVTGGGPLKLSLSLSSSARQQSSLNMASLLTEPAPSQSITTASPVKANVLKLTLGRKV